MGKIREDSSLRYNNFAIYTNNFEEAEKLDKLKNNQVNNPEDEIAMLAELIGRK